MVAEIVILEQNGQKIANVVSDAVEVRSAPDALDLIGNADYMGAHRLVLSEHNLDPGFFDLSSGLAGEILQKFSTYSFLLAIVGQFEHYKSNSLNAFIIECNRGSQIFFVPDLDSAIDKLTGAVDVRRGG